MPAVRPELGPTLPALLRRRHGIPERVTPLLVLGALALVVLLGLALRGDDGEITLVHEDAPQYTLVYAEDRVREAQPRDGELTRLETRSRRVPASVAVRPFRLETDRRGAIYADAPIVMGRRIDALRERLPAFELRGDARTRVNTAPGYEIAYVGGPPDRRTLTRQVILVEDEKAVEGVELTLQLVKPRRRSARDRRAIGAIRSAYRSFRFGTERP